MLSLFAQSEIIRKFHMAGQKYCPNCGAEPDARRTFCEVCGVHLTSGIPIASTFQAETSKVPWHDKTWVILLALLFFWPVGIVLLWISPTVRISSKIIVSTIASFIVFAAVMAFVRDTESQFGSPSALNSAADCLVIENVSGSTSEMTTTIGGMVRNNCGRSFGYVQITYKLFDDSGNVVGTAIANQNDLTAGETWRFQAVGLVNSSHFKFGEIVAY
jgi:hypothetical protein